MRSKQNLIASLPIREDHVTVRAWCRPDVDRRAAWPPYAPPYSDFTSSLSSMGQTERDAYSRTRDEDQNRITLTGDCLSESCIIHIVIRDVDWRNCIVGNMGFRLHPDWCDRGIGTRVLKSVVARFAEAGIACFRLDVAESNARAIRCYEKAGFCRPPQYLCRNRGGIPAVFDPHRWK